MMKSTYILLAFFVLVAITPHLPTITAQLVLDNEGNPLLNGGTYYILSTLGVFRDGGIELAESGTDTCPLTVALSPFPLSNGLPIYISSPLKIANINEGTPLELLFSDTDDLPTCTTIQPKWRVVKDGVTEGWSIKIGDDDSENISGWFLIQNYKDHDKFYEFVFRSYDDTVSGKIGIELDNKLNRRLVLTNEINYNHPLVVQFKVAERDGSSVAA